MRRRPGATAGRSVSTGIECRTDVAALFEAAWRASALSADEAWMYMYSIGPQHSFKHQITRQYRVWVGEVPAAEPGTPPDAIPGGEAGGRR